MIASSLCIVATYIVSSYTAQKINNIIHLLVMTCMFSTILICNRATFVIFLNGPMIQLTDLQITSDCEQLINTVLFSGKLSSILFIFFVLPVVVVDLLLRVSVNSVSSGFNCSSIVSALISSVMSLKYPWELSSHWHIKDCPLWNPTGS